jgi:hypothetical protein
VGRINLTLGFVCALCALQACGIGRTGVSAIDVAPGETLPLAETLDLRGEVPSLLDLRGEEPVAHDLREEEPVPLDVEDEAPTPCVPDCVGRECGDDGCGGSCGVCPAVFPNSYCTLAGQCSCLAENCGFDGSECGSDGCGGSCGECDPGLACFTGHCQGYPFVRRFDRWLGKLGATNVSHTDDGSVLLSGLYVEPGFDMGGGPLDATSEEGEGWRGFVARLDTNRGHVWSRGFEATGGCTTRAVLPGPGEGAFVVGKYSGDALFTSAVTTAAHNLFISRIDSDGAILWTLEQGTEDSDAANSAALAPDGSVVVVGTRAYWGPLPAVDDADLPVGGFVLVVNSAGELLWVKSMSELLSLNTVSEYSSEDSTARAVVIAADGSIYVGGMAPEVDPDLSTVPVGDSSGEEGVVLKLSPDGELVWTFAFGSEELERVDELSLDPDGNVRFAAVAEGSSLTFGELTPTGLGSCTEADHEHSAVIGTLSPSGQVLTAARLCGADEVRAWSLATTTSGQYVAGSTHDEDLDPGGGPILDFDTSVPKEFDFDFVYRAGTDGGFKWALPVSDQCVEDDYAVQSKLVAISVDGKQEVLLWGAYSPRGIAVGDLLTAYPPEAGIYLATLVDCADDPCESCVPTCDDRICGDDGCGGSCGICAPSEFCRAGACLANSCQPFQCGTDGLGGSCGECPTEEECREGLCTGPVHVWSLSAGGESSKAHGDDVVADAAGNVYLIGDFGGELALGEAVLEGIGGSDGLVAKLDPDGNLLWALGVTGSKHQFLDAGAVTPDGGIVVVGDYDSPQATIGGFELNNAEAGTSDEPSPDALVARISPTGDVMWAKALGGPYTDRADDVAVDSTGNIVVVGEYRGAKAAFGGEALGQPCVEAGNLWAPNEIFVAKFSPEGEHIWSMRMGGCDSDYGDAVAIGPDDSIYVGGDFGEDGMHAGSIKVKGAGGKDAYVVRLSPAGEVDWIQSIGGKGSDYVNSLAVGPAGDVVVAGDFGSSILTVGGKEYEKVGANSDSYVARLSPSGETDWVKMLGGLEDDTVSAVHTDADGNIYATGDLESLVIDFGGGELAAREKDNHCPLREDLFAVKLSPTGEHLWSVRYGSTWEDWGKSSFVDSAGNLYLTGESHNHALDFGGAILPICEDNSCSKRLFLVKLTQ